MGNIHISLAPMMRILGAEVVVPPPPNREVLELGVRLAPEAMCIPFKLTLGNMVRSLDMGADTLVYTTGSWSCRYGYYGRLQAQILKDLGFKFRLLELRHDHLPAIVHEGIRLNSGSWTRTIVRAGRAFRIGWHKSYAVEKAEFYFRQTMPFATDSRNCRRLLKDILIEIEQAQSPTELTSIRKGLKKRFAEVPRNGTDWAPCVKLVGESFCTIEPFINFDIIRRLGEIGVLVDPFLTAHRWLGFHGFRIGGDELKRVKAVSSRYWRDCVGGEDQNSLGHLIIAAQKGYDGVIHIHPFGCMPGTVVQPALAKASRDFDIPYLSLSLDEHTSETGLLTRIEAFVSLLKRRRTHRPKKIDTQGYYFTIA